MSSGAEGIWRGPALSTSIRHPGFACESGREIAGKRRAHLCPFSLGGARRSLRGGTLIEVLVSISVFMFVMAAVFVLFQKSYQSFHFLEQRQSVQSQVLRITSVLEADFRATHLVSIGIEPRQIAVGGQNVHRDFVSCLGLDDWLAADNFEPLYGIPIWNQYAVYLTDLQDTSTLQRVTVSRAPGPVTRLTGMASLDPADVKSRQTLCDNLLSLEASVDIASQTVEQIIRLRTRKGAQRGLASGASSESFEARFRWSPKNTIPKL